MICILTENELARNHGTGAQILQMMEGCKFHHFHWHIGPGRKSEVRESLLLVDWLPNVFGLRGIVRRLRRLTGMNWWHGNQINRLMLQSYLRWHGLKFDVAYVVVARETDAARALSIVKALGVRYVVDLMDVMEDNGLDPVAMPAMRELLTGAHGHISLLPSITREMQKFVNAPIQEIPPGKPLTKHIASPPANGERVRIIISGRPYVGGCRLLATALKDIEETCRAVEIIYIGPHYQDLPSELKPHCRDAGFVANDSDYQEFLAGTHLAYLSGPDTNDMHGRWSFPSRTVDYLMAGLPVLACVPEGSSTEEVLKPIAPGGVAFTRTGPEICEAINGFTGDKQSWLAASRTVRSFAEKTMSLEVVRKKVLEALEAAAGTTGGVKARN
ncbi:MAG: hypothetical protein ACLQSR_02965 [Limisphaerales bacterium]